MADKPKSFQSVIRDNPSLGLFLETMAEFEQVFCQFMVSGKDFNIRFEVRGNRGDLIHCRVMTDKTGRPKPERESSNPNNEEF